MSDTGKFDLKHQRNKVKQNVVQLLQENNGKLGMGEFWQMYSKKFKTSLSKKDLGFHRMNELFELYKKDFEVRDDHLYLRNFKKSDKYGLPLPSPIKPLWGAGVKSASLHPIQKADSNTTASGGSIKSTPQRGRGNSPHPARGGARPAPSASQTSISISSSSDTDSDSDSDVRITGQDPPSGRPGQRKIGNDKGNSDFLSLEVPQSGQQPLLAVPLSEPAQPLVFTNQTKGQQQQLPQQQQQYMQQQQKQQQQQQQQYMQQQQQHQYMQQQQQQFMQQGAGRGGGGAPSLADLAGGRGRTLEMFMPQGQASPLMSVQFPMPLHPVGGNRGAHPGVAAGQYAELYLVFLYTG